MQSGYCFFFSLINYDKDYDIFCVRQNKDIYNLINEDVANSMITAQVLVTNIWNICDFGEQIMFKKILKSKKKYSKIISALDLR